MHTIKFSGPDLGLLSSLTELSRHAEFTGSRNGPVAKFPAPVASINLDPRNRVSFSAIRDANPFLHLFESLWMLRGRNDVAFLRYFTEQMVSYSDDGVTLNGAYGHRWISHFNHDQLHDFIIPELRNSPDSRRALMAMWDGNQDVNLLVGEGGRDVPCNSQVVFARVGENHSKLRMTVFNRSNDIVWGCYGANIVHFSFLQEYVACVLNIEVEHYYQISNNMHLYTDNPVSQRLVSVADGLLYVKQDLEREVDNLCAWEELNTYARSPKLFDDSDHWKFMMDLRALFCAFDKALLISIPSGINPAALTAKTYRESITPTLAEMLPGAWNSRFFTDVVDPMIRAKIMYEEDRLEAARDLLSSREGNYDWHVAGARWMQRRIDSRATRQ